MDWCDVQLVLPHSHMTEEPMIGNTTGYDTPVFPIHRKLNAQKSQMQKEHKEFSVRKTIILSVRKLDQSNTTQMWETVNAF